MNTQHLNYGAFRYVQGTKSYRARQLIQALVALNTATHKELPPSSAHPSVLLDGTCRAVNSIRRGLLFGLRGLLRGAQQRPTKSRETIGVTEAGQLCPGKSSRKLSHLLSAGGAAEPRSLLYSFGAA